MLPFFTVAPSLNRVSDGFAAALEFLTTKICEGPASVTVIFRSTSGTTSAYVAVAPSTVGRGNSAGHDNDVSTPSVVIDIRNLSPPPERTTSLGAAFGRSVPFGPATNV